MPAIFGGSQTDEVFIILENYPCKEVTYSLRVGSLLQIAYFSYEAVSHMYLHFDRPDTPEYVLHHVTTLCLVYLGYALNYNGLGTPICALNAMTDVFVSLMRIVYFFPERKGYQLTVYVLMLGGFLYCRDYLGVRILYQYYVEIWANPNAEQRLKTMFPFFACNMALLSMLNYFWTFLMIKAIASRYVLKNENQAETRKHI